MVVKHFVNHILLLEVYSFEGFSNQHKNDGVVNNNSNSCNYVVAILKNPLIYCQRLLVSLLNQARAGHRPARTWFLRIASVRKCLCVCVFVCVCVCPPQGY